MRKLLSALLLGASALAAAQSTEQSYILVGSYTDEVHTDGIYTLSFNPQNGALKRVATRKMCAILLIWRGRKTAISFTL